MATELYLKARQSRYTADVDGAVAAMKASVMQCRLHPHHLVFGAAAIGRLDDAFAMLDRVAKFDARMLAGDSGMLLEGSAAPPQRDARFWPLGAKPGYVKCWRKRDVSPDFCSDASLP